MTMCVYFCYVNVIVDIQSAKKYRLQQQQCERWRHNSTGMAECWYLCTIETLELIAKIRHRW